MRQTSKQHNDSHVTRTFRPQSLYYAHFPLARRLLPCCGVLDAASVQMTGGAPNPSTTLEHVFTLIVSLIGLSIYGLLVGSLTSIISNMNSKQDGQ